MGKVRKSRHRYPVEHMMKSDPVTADYQAEVDRSTAKLEREYAQAQKRLEQAERRAERAGQKPPTSVRRSKATAQEKRLIDLWAEVQLRREELMAFERMMTGSHIGQSHRGRGTFKPVGGTNSSLI